MANTSKIHPTLARYLGLRSTKKLGDQLPIIVRFFGQITAVERDVEGIEEPRQSFHLIPATAHLATPSAVEAISELDAVEMIWMDEPVHSAATDATAIVGANRAWELGLSGKGVRVGIVDSGIDPRHPNLIGRIAQAKDLTGEGPEDSNGHGTIAAGIIGGSGSTNQAQLSGIAPESVLLIAKVLRSDGWSNTSTVMAGIDWAVQQKAQIVNLSLGTDTAEDGNDGLSAMCDAATARGVLVCAAAGNGGPAQSTIGSPGCASTAITVGACDLEDQIASFSSRGPTRDGRSKPDICAPGVHIVACRAAGTSLGAVVDEYYTSTSGTSVATPFISGLCALLLEAHPRLSPSEIKRLLMESAVRLKGDENAQGGGRVDFANLLLLMQVPELGSPEFASPEKRRSEPSGCLAILKNLLSGR